MNRRGFLFSSVAASLSPLLFGKREEIEEPAESGLSQTQEITGDCREEKYPFRIVAYMTEQEKRTFLQCVPSLIMTLNRNPAAGFPPGCLQFESVRGHWRGLNDWEITLDFMGYEVDHGRIWFKTGDVISCHELYERKDFSSLLGFFDGLDFRAFARESASQENENLSVYHVIGSGSDSLS